MPFYFTFYMPWIFIQNFVIRFVFALLFFESAEKTTEIYKKIWKKPPLKFVISLLTIRAYTFTSIVYIKREQGGVLMWLLCKPLQVNFYNHKKVSLWNFLIMFDDMTYFVMWFIYILQTKTIWIIRLLNHNVPSKGISGQSFQLITCLQPENPEHYHIHLKIMTREFCLAFKTVYLHLYRNEIFWTVWFPNYIHCGKVTCRTSRRFLSIKNDVREEDGRSSQSFQHTKN